MNKESLMGLGLLGLPFMCIGVIIGGVVMNKIDNKFEKIHVGRWQVLSETFKELLIDSYQHNDDIRKQLESKEAGA